MRVDPGDTVNPSQKIGNEKNAGRIKRFFWNMISSGLPADYDLETLRKIFLLNLMMVLGSFFLILLGSIEFFLHDYLLSIVNFSFLSFLVWLFVYLRKSKNYKVISLIGATTAGIFYFFLIAYGGIGNTAYMWLFTYPLISIFLLGARKGTVFSLILLLMACVVFIFGPKIPIFSSYNLFLKIRFVPAYLTIYLLAFIMEKTREIVGNRLEIAKSETERTIEKLEKANDALRESEAQYRQLFESIQDVFYRTKLNGEIVSVSPSIKEVTGYDPEEMIGRFVQEFYGNSLDRERLVKEMMVSGKVTNYELALKAKNGREMIAGLTGRLIYDRNGQPEGFAGVMRDITEQKLAAAALSESEERYRLLADNVTDNLWIFDLGTMRFSYVSPSVVGITGYTADEATGFQMEDSLTPPSLELATKLLAEEIFEASQNFDPSRSRTIELEQYHKAGGTIWTEVSVKFIYNPEKQPVAILGVTRDISERKRLQNQLQKSQKMESLGLLAGGVAHDLNNVLSGIVSYPELLLMDLPHDSKLRKPLETMRESGLRAAAIVQDLLTIARGVATTFEPLNLNDMVREYLTSPEFHMLKKYYPDVTVKTILDPDLLNIAASQVHIRKAIMNLVSNAAEAIKDIGNIRLSTMNRYVDKPLKGYDEIIIGEYAVFSVSDDGSGISSGDLERIFEPFYTKKKLGRSGTGLGLAVVWNVMQDHKGYINVTTGENGTMFELYFPITREALLKKGGAVPIEDLKGHGETVLVVDDVESQREISCRILDALGYHCKAVSGGEEAVLYLKENSVDVILLDMIMDPGMNGHETYKRIIQIHPGQKAVIVSGFSETDDVRKTQALGAGKYVKKPLTLEKIGLAIKAELHG